MAKAKDKGKAAKIRSKKAEKEFEDNSEKKIEEKIEKRLETKLCSSAIAKVVGEIIGYVIFLFFLYIIFPRFTFVTDKYPLWVPIAFWTTTIGTLLKIIKHLSVFNFIKRILEIGSITLSFYSTYMLLLIYPLDFSRIGFAQLNFIFPFALNIALLAMILAIFVNFIRIFIPESKGN